MKTARASLPLCIATAIATVAGATAVFGVATAAEPTSMPQKVQQDAPAALAVETEPGVDPAVTAWPSLDATSVPLFEQAAYQIPWGPVSREPGQHMATPSPTPTPTPRPTPPRTPSPFAASIVRVQAAQATYVRPQPTPRPVIRAPAPVRTPTPLVVAVSSVAAARSYALSVVGSAQFVCLDALFTRESHWNPFASNSVTGAYGIPQALPGIKMAAAGADWRTNPVTQVKWGLSYIVGSYGTPCAAWTHELSAGWY